MQQWSPDFERLIEATYLDIIRTSVQRSREHNRALQSLQDAVELTNELTLQFLEDYMGIQPIDKHDGQETKTPEGPEEAQKAETSKES